MKLSKYFLVSIFVVQLSFAQDSSYTFQKITGDIYSSFTETIEWYDIPILLSNQFSNKIFGNKGNLQFIKITPLGFEKNINNVLGANNNSSLGSMDKNIIPTFLLASRISLSLGRALLLDDHLHKNDLKHTLVFYKSLVYTNLITEFIKAIVHKDRPDNTDSRSFFSGHSSTTFAASTFIYREIKDFIGSWDVTQKNEFLKYSLTTLSFASLYGWSGYVGLSRIRDNKHYLADVVIGAAVGTYLSNYLFDSYFGNESMKLNIKFEQTYDATYLGFSFNLL